MPTAASGVLNTATPNYCVNNALDSHQSSTQAKSNNVQKLLNSTEVGFSQFTA